VSDDEGPAAEPTDLELVAQGQSGDQAALNELVQRHHGGAYRVALSFVQDVDTAQDVVQEAFLKAFRALHSFRGDAAFRSWLFTITANEARATFRRSGRRREASLEDVDSVRSDEMSPADAAVISQEAERARRMLKDLPDKQRMSVSLRIDEGLSFKEIGEVIGSSEGAARVNYFHGIRRLRELMQ